MNRIAYPFECMSCNANNIIFPTVKNIEKSNWLAKCQKCGTENLLVSRNVDPKEKPKQYKGEVSEYKIIKSRE